MKRFLGIVAIVLGGLIVTSHVYAGDLSSIPAINSIQPASGMPGAMVTLTGSGFTSRNNKITFGNVNGRANTITASSADEKTLVFNIPLHVKCAAGNIGCVESGTHLTSAGQYNIAITNANGTSNSIMYTVTNNYEQVTPLVITSVTPGSAKPGEIATITGSGFSPKGNRIKIGNFNIENNPEYNLSSDGKTITFTVPMGPYAPCALKICPPSATIIPEGSHLVSVINAQGESNRVPIYIIHDREGVIRTIIQDGEEIQKEVGAEKNKICEKPNITQRLRMSFRGAEVTVLQKILAHEGLLAGDKIDGSFGARTHLAVMKLQRKLGLAADGVVGTKTRAAIHTQWANMCL
ncbi:MAG TPA: IPT/TIG domain-containing protein [Candidatus Paceibacterota bacterium]